MRLHKIGALALFWLVGGVAAGSTAADTAVGAAAWIGHYPSDTVLGVRGLFEVPGLRQQLAALLSKADLKTIKNTYSVETPVVEEDGFIVASVCMPHDCDAEGATMIIDPKTNDVAVGFVVDDAGPKADQRQRRLYSSFDYTRLPAALVGQLSTLKGAGA